MNIALLTHAAPLRPSRLSVMRLNRALAWAMVVSPVIQLVFHLNFMRALVFDLGLLIAHGALSLALFGLPNRKDKELSASMYLLGFRDRGMSERNNFLLSGYRIALGTFPILLTIAVGPFAVSAFSFLYPLLRLPVSVFQHLAGGVEYAFKRWGLRNFAVPLGATVGTLYFGAYWALLIVSIIKR